MKRIDIKRRPLSDTVLANLEDWFNNQKEIWSSKHISNVRALLNEFYIALANKRISQTQHFK